MNEPMKYVRKLSGEEAIKRYILVLKDHLKIFPKVGTQFRIKIDNKLIKTEINLVEVWNQGSRHPGIEYHIDLSKHVDLFRPHFGQKVTLTKKSEKTFELSM